MQFMEQGAERRTMKRYRCSGRVEIPRSYTSVPLYGILMDVSATGCGICVPTGADFEAEEECWVELKFKSSYMTFRAVGAVRSQHQHQKFGGAMLGFEFVEMTSRGKADIAAFLHDQQPAELANGARELAYA